MKKNRRDNHTLRLKIATNLVLSTLVFSVGVLCLSPFDESVSADIDEIQLYRCAEEKAEGVSLMFNVYWGTEYVYQILDILEKHQATASFFIGGCWADDNVECLKAISAKGHEIGNHGYFHKDHAALTLTNNQKEIADCNRFIELAIGVKPTLFAPPSGSYNNVMLSACKGLRMKTILWTKDTIDWRDKDSSVIYTRATKGVEVGDFVLMHPMKETADALNDILKYYKENNLKVVTVSENLQLEG